MVLQFAEFPVRGESLDGVCVSGGDCRYRVSGQGVHEHFLSREIFRFKRLVLLNLIGQGVIFIPPPLCYLQVGAMIRTEGKFFTN